jgi:hypothetical protein
MDGRMTRYQWKSSLPEELSQAAREVIDVLAGAPGLKACYAMKVSDTETVVVSVWDDQAAAEEALPLVEPAIQRIVGTTIAGEPENGRSQALHPPLTVNGRFPITGGTP